jgi:hypothetical protein
MRKILLIGLCAALGGCQSIGDWADDVGTHLPVLSDQSCEHWQCFTSDGQAESDMNRKMREERWRQEEQQEQQGQVQQPIPAQPQSSQPAPKPSGYQPPPDMDPWNNYHP